MPLLARAWIQDLGLQRCRACCRAERPIQAVPVATSTTYTAPQGRPAQGPKGAQGALPSVRRGGCGRGEPRQCGEARPATAGHCRVGRLAIEKRRSSGFCPSIPWQAASQEEPGGDCRGEGRGMDRGARRRDGRDCVQVDWYINKRNASLVAIEPALMADLTLIDKRRPFHSVYFHGVRGDVVPTGRYVDSTIRTHFDHLLWLWIGTDRDLVQSRSFAQ